MDCPDQFVDSSLGRLPRQWLVLQLKDVARITSGATPSRSIRAFWRGGTIPWVKTTEVDFSIILDTEEKMTLTALNSTALRIYPVGTVLVAMYGQGATRGRSAILGVAATTNQACAAILGNPGYVSQRFLFHYMRANYDRLRRLGHGSQQTNLSGSLLEDMLIALPSKREQKRIYDVLDRLDERSGHEHARARKLRLVKEGLKDDLLTGRVRVSAEEVSA
jgi:type I restriction enzyme S subunit